MVLLYPKPNQHRSVKKGAREIQDNAIWVWVANQSVNKTIHVVVIYQIQIFLSIQYLDATSSNIAESNMLHSQFSHHVERFCMMLNEVWFPSNQSSSSSPNISFAFRYKQQCCICLAFVFNMVKRANVR